MTSPFRYLVMAHLEDGEPCYTLMKIRRQMTQTEFEKMFPHIVESKYINKEQYYELQDLLNTHLRINKT